MAKYLLTQKEARIESLDAYDRHFWLEFYDSEMRLVDEFSIKAHKTKLSNAKDANPTSTNTYQYIPPAYVILVSGSSFHEVFIREAVESRQGSSTRDRKNPVSLN